MAREMSLGRSLLRRFDSLEELLLDKDLAALGDSYVNFVYSLAMSKKFKRPTGAKVNNQVLAQAVALSGVRKHLPHRVDRHTRANAAEALLVYAWLRGFLEMDECTKVLSEEADLPEAFAKLLKAALSRIGVADERKKA